MPMEWCETEHEYFPEKEFSTNSAGLRKHKPQGSSEEHDATPPIPTQRNEPFKARLDEGEVEA